MDRSGKKVSIIPNGQWYYGLILCGSSSVPELAENAGDDPGIDRAVAPADIWSVLDFEADEAAARELAEAFADVLDQPGWYVNFQSPTESFVVFPGRIYHYPRGDQAGRADAQAYGRQLAIPEPQLDWTE